MVCILSCCSYEINNDSEHIVFLYEQIFKEQGFKNAIKVMMLEVNLQRKITKNFFRSGARSEAEVAIGSEVRKKWSEKEIEMKQSEAGKITFRKKN